ncbi:amidohydrolase [Gulosibacter faecalis]|uniref:Amidohydrolase n=1 Tax=Gulosibacter faecalis TaxID=272240 RepID=A0ABW5UWX2_9MICO|nr:amidohydrolase [Gulosibacter faecalis]
MPETTLFLHPNIRTLAGDGAEPDGIAGGIVARDGRIVFIGGEADARAEAGADARVVELPGAAVLPAFHDAHIHAGALAVEALGPDLRGAESYADALRLLREFAEANPGDGWVLGGSWNSNDWRDGEPHRRELDEIFGDRPVLLSTIDGHADWANSAALEAGGITDSTPDPDGGRIERDATGTPTGLLLENASSPLWPIASAGLAPQLPGLLDRLQDDLLALGLAHLTDIDVLDVLDAFERLRDEGRLKLRVHKYMRAHELSGAIARGWCSGEGDDWLTHGGVKLFADGALGPHTAHLHEPFEGEGENAGIAVTGDAELERAARAAVAAGIEVAVHAIGDRANTRVLDVFAGVADVARERGLRLRIEHAQHLKPADVARFADLGVIASMQPTHATSDYPLSVRLLGDRETLHYPWRTLLDSGARLAFGSDSPVEPANPFFAVHAAVTRERRDGVPEGGREPEQRLTVRGALVAHTLGGAVAAALDDRTGSLEQGKFCDLIAVDVDPFEADPRDLWRTRVLTTVVGGEVRFAAARPGRHE